MPGDGDTTVTSITVTARPGGDTSKSNGRINGAVLSLLSSSGATLATRTLSTASLLSETFNFGSVAGVESVKLMRTSNGCADANEIAITGYRGECRLSGFPSSASAPPLLKFAMCCFSAEGRSLAVLHNLLVFGVR